METKLKLEFEGPILEIFGDFGAQKCQFGGGWKKVFFSRVRLGGVRMADKQSLTWFKLNSGRGLTRLDILFGGCGGFKRSAHSAVPTLDAWSLGVGKFQKIKAES